RRDAARFCVNDTATTEIYTLSLHDALPISHTQTHGHAHTSTPVPTICLKLRSEEHTSELQSHLNIVCRLLLEKKQTATRSHTHTIRHTSALTYTATPTAN